MWCTLLTEHEVTNKVTFSAVCTVYGLLLPRFLSTEFVSKLFSSLCTKKSAYSAFSTSYLEILSAVSLNRYRLLKLKYGLYRT